jgi:Outer membrane lipoprotein carrier protein LolA-like
MPMPMPTRASTARPDRRGAAWPLGCRALLLAICAHGAAAAAPGFDLAQLADLLGRVKSGEARFVEKRQVEMLGRTLESSGRLRFHAPASFSRETLKPRHELLAVDGNVLTMSSGGRSRTLQLDSAPEAAIVVEAVRGTLTGNREALERFFAATVSGDAQAWTLDLVPRDEHLRGQVASVRLRGLESAVREVQVMLADGDRSIMTIEPLPGSGAP